MNTIYCYTCSAWVLKYYHYNIDYKQWVIQYFIFKNGYFYISYRGIKTCLVFIFYTYLIIAIAIFFFINSFHVGMWLWQFVKFLYVEM